MRTSPSPRQLLTRGTADAVARARLSVVPRLRSRAPRVPFVTLVSVLLLAGVVGLLLFNTSMQQASFTASRLEDQAADLTARQQALSADIDGLRNPQRLAEKARKQGLVIAPAPTTLDLDTGEFNGPMLAATREDDLRIDPPPAPSLPTPAPIEVPADDVHLDQADPRGDGEQGNGQRGNGQRGNGQRGEGQRGEGQRGEGQRGEGQRGDQADTDGQRDGAPRGDRARQGQDGRR